MSAKYLSAAYLGYERITGRSIQQQYLQDGSIYIRLAASYLHHPSALPGSISMHYRYIEVHVFDRALQVEKE